MKRNHPAEIRRAGKPTAKVLRISWQSLTPSPFDLFLIWAGASLAQVFGPTIPSTVKGKEYAKGRPADRNNWYSTTKNTVKGAEICRHQCREQISLDI
jgi:hypothetical protein